MHSIPARTPTAPVVDVSGIERSGLADLADDDGRVVLSQLVAFLCALEPEQLSTDVEVLELAAAWRAVASAAGGAELRALAELVTRSVEVLQVVVPASWLLGQPLGGLTGRAVLRLSAVGAARRRRPPR